MKVLGLTVAMGRVVSHLKVLICGASGRVWSMSWWVGSGQSKVTLVQL